MSITWYENETTADVAFEVIYFKFPDSIRAALIVSGNCVDVIATSFKVKNPDRGNVLILTLPSASPSTSVKLKSLTDKTRDAC